MKFEFISVFCSKTSNQISFELDIHIFYVMFRKHLGKRWCWLSVSIETLFNRLCIIIDNFHILSQRKEYLYATFVESPFHTSKYNSSITAHIYEPSRKCTNKC